MANLAAARKEVIALEELPQRGKAPAGRRARTTTITPMRDAPLVGRRPESLSAVMDGYRSVDVSKMRAGAFLQAQDEIEKVKLAAVAAGSGWAAVASCPLCGASRRQSEFFKHGIELVRCLQCEVRYGAHVPANLDDVYKNAAYAAYSKEDSDEHYDYRRQRFGRERVELLQAHCGELSDKRLIDVGCGNGYFISVAKDHCGQTFGTEYSERLRRFATAKTGLRVFGESLQDLPETGFDIVTLFDVIEHIPDPHPFMRAVDNLLNPGGHILIYTPNFDSFGIKAMGAYSSIVDPTEHVVLYTLPSLRVLAAQLGYDVVFTQTAGLDVQNIAAMHDFKGEAPSSFLKQWHNELQAMVNAASCGDYARIILRKPS
jgi:2-polyprenyl-3-methyl-5-hydroxy-6-metoxy-1,4-benzoquinol methylase